MEYIKYCDIGKKAWDGFCLYSPDACFYHTSTNIDFTMNMHFQKEKAENISFAIKDKGKIIAIIPLIKEELYNKPGYYQFGFSGSYQPFPAFNNEIDGKLLDNLLKAIFTEIDNLAKDQKISYAAFAISPMNPRVLNLEWRVNPLPRYGFNDTQVATRILNLLLSEEEIFSSFRKGHKADIKYSLKINPDIKIYDSSSINDGVFKDYQNLHLKAAGRKTRPDRTWEIMHEWIQNDMAILALYYTTDKKCIAGSLNMIYKDRAFYGSAAMDPDSKNERGAMHIILWESIKYLKSRGLSWFETGLQSTPTLSQEVATRKELHISLFKRGFGGVDYPHYRGEKFYDYDFMSQIMQERITQLQQLHNQ